MVSSLANWSMKQPRRTCTSGCLNQECSFLMFSLKIWKPLETSLDLFSRFDNGYIFMTTRLCWNDLTARPGAHGARSAVGKHWPNPWQTRQTLHLPTAVGIFLWLKPLMLTCVYMFQAWHCLTKLLSWCAKQKTCLPVCPKNASRASKTSPAGLQALNWPGPSAGAALG